MKLRYELVDSKNPYWRGMRFTKLESAQKELARSVPPGRFYIKDRLEKKVVRDDGSVENS